MRQIQAGRLLVLWILGLSSTLSAASDKEFRNRYIAEVNDQTWVLNLDSRRSFASMISAKLQMGDALNRMILLGNIDEGLITGTYKPLRVSAMADEKIFTLQWIDDRSVRLTLDGANALARHGITLHADANVNPVDDALVGRWYSDVTPGIDAQNPYMGQQWSIQFQDDGSLCEDSRRVDSRQPPQDYSPCEQGSKHLWKAENGKIHVADDNGNWSLKFDYRLMGGRLVVSYPDGQRRIASRPDQRLSAQ